MSKHLLGFPNKKERNDFLIALVVIVFFGWIMTRTMGCNDKKDNLQPSLETPILIDDNTKADVDTDGDGVMDVNDRCPNVAGVLENNGCPVAIVERTETNVVEKKVPNEIAETVLKDDAATVGTAGTIVLDTKEAKDKLVDQLETAKPLEKKSDINSPTRDSDGDGIPDVNDKCPNLTGIEANNGCPSDKDGDGVYDNIDKCPTVAGVKANKGCPADSDGDGVYDKDDKCPNKKGVATNNGCPKVIVEKAEQEVLEKAIQAVEFDTGKDRLKRASTKVLDQIVPILKKYPKYNLAIIGHTDNRGKADQNMRLSQNRARACMNYLISKGIAANRLIARGKGDTQPIASNDTVEGRSKNRRVEFNLQD